jgi:hypothetical protein
MCINPNAFITDRDTAIAFGVPDFRLVLRATKKAAEAAF